MACNEFGPIGAEAMSSMKGLIADAALDQTSSRSAYKNIPETTSS
jgi:hypothetical protein